MKVAAIVVAAGRGTRIGGAVSKQFIEIEGKPILYYTLLKFQQCHAVHEIIVVVPKQNLAELKRQLVEEWNLKKVSAVAAGGNERSDSVRNGLRSLSSDINIVMIHDGVRPFVSSDLIEKLVAACRKHGASTLGVTPKDTIKLRTGNFIKQTLVRDSLVAIQTPQVFRRDLIEKAYESAQRGGFESTDDAALVERMGQPVFIIEGVYTNIKITSVEDVILTEALIKRKEN